MYELSLASAASNNNAQNAAAFQKAMQLHQCGKIESATSLSKDLAEKGHIQSQIYALSLRHGWDCKSDPKTAMSYLYVATRVAIEFELRARDQGLCFRSQAPNELKLRLFEITNSLRHS